MFDDVLLQLGQAAAVFQGLYWLTLIVGGGMVAISALSGSQGDGDVDVDASGDVDLDADGDVDVGQADVDAGDGDFDMQHDVGQVQVGDHGADVLSLTTWFSVRFVIFFMAVFGAIGLLGTYFSGLNEWATLGVAVLGGTVVGQGVHQVYRLLQRTSGNTQTSVADFLRKPARVSIAIVYPRKGEVAVNIRSSQYYMPATAKREDTNFKVNDDVVIVGYQGGVVEVVSREEFDFLNQTD